MFSVIIPYFCSSCTINDCIASVLVQTFGEYEIIVVDDGSPYNQRAQIHIASQFKEKIQLLSLEENRGVAAARNIGIMHARHKYVCFLDSDDLWDPCYLQHMKTALEDDTYIGAYGNYRVFNQSPLRSVGGFQNRYSFITNQFYRICIYDFIPMSASVIKKSQLKGIKFDGSFSPSEDWKFWIDIIQSSRLRVKYVPSALCYYREHSGGISKNKRYALISSLKTRLFAKSLLPWYANWVVYLVSYEGFKSEILTLLKEKNIGSAIKLYLAKWLVFGFIPGFYVFLFSSLLRKLKVKFFVS